MPKIRVTAIIAAPIDRVFDLARSIDLHLASQRDRHERAIAGVTTGLISLGQEVTWRATHFGLPLRLTSRITALSAPHHFRDSMVRGPFHAFDHDHFFESDDGHTVMNDIFDYTSPIGLLGRLADRWFLHAYMTRFLEQKAVMLKDIAETDRWQRFLDR